MVVGAGAAGVVGGVGGGAVVGDPAEEDQETVPSMTPDTTFLTDRIAINHHHIEKRCNEPFQLPGTARTRTVPLLRNHEIRSPHRFHHSQPHNQTG